MYKISRNFENDQNLQFFKIDALVTNVTKQILVKQKKEKKNQNQKEENKLKTSEI